MDQEAKEEQFRKEYQQYTRKNYLRRDKAAGKAESDLIGRLRSKRNLSEEGNRNDKSRSALEYAKYFIKQVSVSPPEDSLLPGQPSNEGGLSPSRPSIEDNQASLNRDAIASR